MPPPNPKDVAAKLVANGPHKTEVTPRRLRGVLCGYYIFDTTSAVYVWEHPYFFIAVTIYYLSQKFRDTEVGNNNVLVPFFYIPESAISSDIISKDGIEASSESVKAWNGHIVVGDRKIEIIGFSGTGPLNNLVRIPPKSLDFWYAEDELLHGHPKDPYKRIEILPSSRTISIRSRESHTLLAETSAPTILFETMLRPRYYLPPTCVVSPAMLVPSKTTTFCPYKGHASYYNIRVAEGEVIEDAVWYYDFPLPESAQVKGKLCFYDEKVEVWLDGKKMD